MNSPTPRTDEGSAQAFDLDPDFRRNPPRDKDGKLLPCCAKCQRKVNTSKARRAWVHWGTNEVSLSKDAFASYAGFPACIAEEWIGPDCWKEIGLP